MKFTLGKSISSALRAQKKIGTLIGVALKVPRGKTKGPRHTSTRPKRGVLQETSAFGSNPGRLVMKSFVPARLQKRPALVVLLHGCHQTPESLDAASGFSRLAKERGFVLLCPEQTLSNNLQKCFNWFRPSAVVRDRGEMLSIKQMIEDVCVRNRIDRAKIYVAGLSAGGAMASALVANYPELFAGAAIFAGMPAGSARDAMSALRAMKSGAVPPRVGWGYPVTQMSPGAKSRPSISIWQGTGDRVVNPLNADACVAQWLQVFRIADDDGRLEKKPWGTRESWKGAGDLRLSLYSIDDMGHGLPIKKSDALATKRPRDPFVLPAAISAPTTLMRIWGLPRLTPVSRGVPAN